MTSELEKKGKPGNPTPDFPEEPGRKELL